MLKVKALLLCAAITIPAVAVAEDGSGGSGLPANANPSVDLNAPVAVVGGGIAGATTGKEEKKMVKKAKLH